MSPELIDSLRAETMVATGTKATLLAEAAAARKAEMERLAEPKVSGYTESLVANARERAQQGLHYANLDLKVYRADGGLNHAVELEALRQVRAYFEIEGFSAWESHQRMEGTEEEPAHTTHTLRIFWAQPQA